MASVFIKAEHVRDLNNGAYELIIQSVEATEAEQLVLHRLLPNLCDQAYDLLAKEALLAALASPADIAKPSGPPSKYAK